ncbi:MAG: RloB domain-containing protein [Cyanobacteria bacterium P01_G01_bin.54]
MARKKRPVRQSKKVYGFIVEGHTEANYLKCLKQLYRQGAQIWNCAGGHGIGVMREAKKMIKEHGDDYSGYVVWFDGNRYYSKDKPAKEKLEADKKFTVEIYISLPCVENWLLAHFEPIQTTDCDCKLCQQRLQKHISNYEKNNFTQLQQAITSNRVEQAMQNYPEIEGDRHLRGIPAKFGDRTA